MHLRALGATSLAVRQAAAVVVGLVLLGVLRQVHTAQLRRLAWTAYGVSVALLAVVAAFGSSDYGARRWLNFGAATFQPSEIAKIGLLLALGQVLATTRPWWQRFGLAALVALPVIALVVIEPDLSTATVLSAMTLAMLLLGRIPLPALATALLAVADCRAVRGAPAARLPTGTAARLPGRVPWRRRRRAGRSSRHTSHSPGAARPDRRAVPCIC